jgi:hypothetical protein
MLVKGDMESIFWSLFQIMDNIVFSIFPVNSEKGFRDVKIVF